MVLPSKVLSVITQPSQFRWKMLYWVGSYSLTAAAGGQQEPLFFKVFMKTCFAEITLNAHPASSL